MTKTTQNPGGTAVGKPAKSTLSQKITAGLGPIPTPSMTHLVTPYNSKGGVGKSFIALSLVAGIKNLVPAARILLIDATQDQSTHSADFAPEKEVEGLGLGSAIGHILQSLDSGEAKARRGVELALEVVEQSLTKISVCPPSEENDGLVDFLPNAADEIIYHSKAWSTLPKPEIVIQRLLAPLIEANRWDWIVVDLPAALDGISMRGFLPCASAVVIPEDVRHRKNLTGIERTLRSLRKLSDLRLAGFLPNFISDNEPCKECLTTLENFAKTEDVPMLPGLPNVLTLTKSADTVYVTYGDQDVVGSGIYHLLSHSNPKVRMKALEAIPVVEKMAFAIMNAAISTEE